MRRHRDGARDDLSTRLAALAPSSSAAAGWTAPFAISADRSVLGASAGADARGGVVAVWQHDTKRAQPPRDGGLGGTESLIRARAITADGRHGRVETLSIRDDLTAGPAVAVHRGGDAVAVWTQATTAAASRSSPRRARAPGASAGRRRWAVRTASSAPRRVWR